MCGLQKSHAEGRLHGLRDQMKQFKRDLEGDYKNAEKKYMDMKIDLRVRAQLTQVKKTIML